MSNTKNNSLRNVLFISIAGSAAYVIGQPVIGLSPVFLTSLMNGLDLSATKAGFLLTLEMLTLSFSTLLLASALGIVSKRTMFVGGLALIVFGQILSAMSETFALMAFGRILVGLGGAMIVTIANAAISITADPERIFALVFVLSGIAWAILLPVLTMLSAQWDYVGVFCFLAVLAVVLTPFCTSLFKHHGATTTRFVIPRTHPPLAYLTLLVITLYFCGAGSAWTFAAQIGVQANVNNRAIGIIFGAVTLVGLLGGFLASWVSTKKGRVMPIVGGGLVQIVSIFLFSTSTTPIEYTATLMMSTMSFYFIYPYMLGAAAMFGEQGRWGAAGGGAALLGLALSSSVGGVLVDWGGYQMIGIAFILMGIVSILVITFVIARFKASTALSVEQREIGGDALEQSGD